MYDFDLGQSSEIDYEVDDRLTNAFFYRISSWCHVIFTGIPSNCTRDLILTGNMGNLGLIYGVLRWNVDGVTFFKGAFSFSMLYYQLQGLELYKTESPGAFQEPHRFLKAQYLSKSLIAKATSLKPPRSAAAMPLLRCGWLRLRESPVCFLEKLMEDWRK